MEVILGKSFSFAVLTLSTDAQLSTPYNEGTSDSPHVNIDPMISIMQRIQHGEEAWHDDNLGDVYGRNPHLEQDFSLQRGGGSFKLQREEDEEASRRGRGASSFGPNWVPLPPFHLNLFDFDLIEDSDENLTRDLNDDEFCIHASDGQSLFESLNIENNTCNPSLDLQFLSEFGGDELEMGRWRQAADQQQRLTAATCGRRVAGGGCGVEWEERVKEMGGENLN
ncbi:hypothetical protein M9H77_18648 [Catharanthus roseus]|uniref:Uncharacterized protein n=1 Tax=Catharanthus roseus TaxID=4058 RepID=A0ACC0B814_CATRO|nr:hypothetical protein M9H77_18648 [Catharanthus roseus]